MAEAHSPLTLEGARRLAQRNGETLVPAFCAMCGPGPMSCGIYAFVKEGRFVRCAGMAESPVNRGSLCPKAHAAPQWVYSPERLTHPLRRVGAKGEGRFERISWDDAIGVIAETLLKQKAAYGPESLAILSPALRSYSDHLRRFLTVHGSPNYGHSGICAMQRAFGFMYTLADWPGPEIPKSDLVIYWGRQPVYSGPATPGPRLMVEAKARGARLVAIKPSIEPDSGMADIWVPLRPGTDAALALAMLHVVMGEGLVDRAFVEQWCHGYGELEDHVRQYPPEWAEAITGVPAAQIRELARLYATTPRACIDLGNGVEHAPSASDAIRAVAILIAITGHLDQPGGNVFGGPMGALSTMPMPRDIMLRERYTPELLDKLVGPEFPRPFQPFIEGPASAYYRIFDSILTEKPYPIRAVIAPGTQPSVSTRGSRHVLEALAKLDFYVVADVARTADMAYADIVMPTATPYESGCSFDGRGGWLMARRKVIEPLGDYKSMVELLIDLGVAMGYGKDFWDGSVEAAMDEQLQPFGLTLEALRAHPTGICFPPGERRYGNYAQVFARRSPRLGGAPFLAQGKVALYNTTFEAEGYSPMPEWREPPESLTATPELRERYPLLLSDYHTSMNFTASWQRHVPALRELEPDPMLHLHPDTASARGIAQGDWVVVESPRGSLRLKAELYPGIRPDTVMVLHGWWQGCAELGKGDTPLLDGGANVNLLYSVDPDRAFDPLVTAMSSQALVEVRRA
nr:molybdopterin-dependent oxidoreductase [uncultured Holophaga sp.]